MAQGPGGTIASTEQLEEFASLPPDQRVARLDAAARGVLAETALRGRQRYQWRLLLPLLHALIDVLLAEYTPPEEEGPPRPPPPGFEAAESLGARLHSLLDGFEAAPFTLQRLCEVLLEPRKQYARLDKVAVAVEKLLMVTSTRQPDPPASLPPPPQLSELRGVNDNPPSPYLDGRPPQVLDPQQHQALLQQQGRLGGMANGLGDSGLRGAGADGDGSAAAAAAAADAMQLDVAPMTAAAAEAAVAAQAAAAAAAAPAPPPITAAEAEVAAEFVHSALADEEGSPPGSGAGSSPPAARGSTPPEQQAQAGAAEPSPAGKRPGQGATTSPAAAAEPAADGDAAMSAAEGLQQAGAAQAGARAGQPGGEGASGVTAMDTSPAKQQQQQRRPGEELQ